MHADLFEGATLAGLLSKAKEAPRLFFVDNMEPYRSYAAKVDALGLRKQYGGRLLLYKWCRLNTSQPIEDCRRLLLS